MMIGRRELLIAAAGAAGFTTRRGSTSGAQEPGRNSGRGFYSVLDYGAKCDGRTDDAPAIQAAVDTVAANGSGQVFLPTGKGYRLASTLTVRAASISIVGASTQGALLLPDPGIVAITFVCPTSGGKYCGDAVLKRFRILGGLRGIEIYDEGHYEDGDYRSQASYGVIRHRFEDIFIEKPSADGIYAHGFLIENCQFDNVQVHGGSHQGASPTAFGARFETCLNVTNFRGCQFRLSSTCGVSLHGRSSTPNANVIRGVTFLNCLIESNYQTGVELTNGDSVEFLGSWFENNGMHDDGRGTVYPAIAVAADPAYTTRSLCFRGCVWVPGPHDGGYALQVKSDRVAGPIVFDNCSLNIEGQKRVDLGAYPTTPTLRIQGEQPLLVGSRGRRFAVDEFGNLETGGELRHTGIQSLAPISRDQDDVPTAGCSILRLKADGPHTITGLAGGSGGRQLHLVNVGTQSIHIANENASSRRANRIITGSGAPLTLAPDRACLLFYDLDSERWRVLGRG